MKKTCSIAIAFLISFTTGAQGKPADTVVIELARTSRVVFTMKDRSDLELLKQYDFQALFNDMLYKLEIKDTVRTLVMIDTPHTEAIVTTPTEVETWGAEDDDDEWDKNIQRKYRHHRTRHSFNFDLGTNNFLEDGNFPDADGSQYAVRPWGSWYVGVNSIQRTHVGNKFFIEWGIGVSWYNFKFQEDNTLLTEDDAGVIFSADPRDVSFIKSKLTVSYINASLIPMIDVGGYNRKARFWNSHNSAFRIGAGPYVGYRIGSYTKMVYKEDGDREKDKDRDNFYLNNLRYGMRVQVGVRSADFFFNYDMNELFSTGRGPKLNAFSFGVIF
jgi:hypothetical protein